MYCNYMVFCLSLNALMCMDPASGCHVSCIGTMYNNMSGKDTCQTTKLGVKKDDSTGVCDEQVTQGTVN